VFAEQAYGLLQEIDRIGGRVCIAPAKPGIQIQARLPFESQQWMIALITQWYLAV